MNLMTSFFKSPIGAGLVAFLLGLFIGLYVLGWWLIPVEYINGAFKDLRDVDQQEYVRLVADSYALDLDVAKAQRRLASLCSLDGTAICLKAAQAVSSTVAAAANDPVELPRLAALQAVVSAAGISEPPPSTSTAPWWQLPLMVCGLVVLIALAVGAYFYWRTMSSSSGISSSKPKPAFKPTPSRLPAEGTMGEAGAAVPASSPTGNAPIAQFMTTYVLGDDTYDDSFPVDSPDGMFLGECGMGISETIGVGDPKKVMAFEVWLFDKNDIRTVTRVLMSEHAFKDEALKSRLAAKGDPVLVKPGDVVSMDTATLTVTARVVDMAYGGGALPPNSHFERLTIELAAYQKAAV
jgi:hypothetical protein